MVWSKFIVIVETNVVPDIRIKLVNTDLNVPSSCHTTNPVEKCFKVYCS